MPTLVTDAVRDIRDTIEFSLRRPAREWGVYYATRPGETPDPDAQEDHEPDPA